VHERQVDNFIELYGQLYEALGILHRMTGTVVYGGDKPEEYPDRLNKTITVAYEKLLVGRLLMPPELVEQCDKFFKLVFDINVDLSFAHHPMIIDGLQRAKFWDSAQSTAYEKLPALLQQIEKSARSVIHGETQSIN
jgi:hypothetical protein